MHNNEVKLIDSLQPNSVCDELNVFEKESVSDMQSKSSCLFLTSDITPVQSLTFFF